jgi:hypothetical protein
MIYVKQLDLIQVVRRQVIPKLIAVRNTLVRLISMETFIKILPIIVVVLVVFLVREGLSFCKYLKNCQLHEAAKTDKIDKVRKLLKEGHPVNALDSRFGLTPLHFAVRNGRMEIAQLLIENGASLTQPSTQGI